ncbi:MAG: LysR substrate-binding domain-containing protein [Acidimicrobiia bacterium]|nr:LysR substrate-binding domain-containing protein [Acidimicrobiia bacterium]
MKLDVESLRALKAVVDTGTFTEAAARLGMTQSAVSWKIKRLEERVGHELVKRGQEIEATPDGRDLLHYADRVLTAHDEAVAHLSRSDLEGVIRLGTNEDLRGGQLADVLGRFGRMYPHIRLDVRVQLSGEVRDWFDDGEVDLAVVQIPASEVRPDDVELWREQLVWVQSVDHDFDSGAVVPVVSFGPGLVYLDLAEESLKRGSLRWRTVLECPMLSGVQAAVEAGLGIAALNPRNFTGAMKTWSHNADHPLPELCEVIRTANDGDPEVLGALRDALTTSLGGRS